MSTIQSKPWTKKYEEGFEKVFMIDKIPKTAYIDHKTIACVNSSIELRLKNNDDGDYIEMFDPNTYESIHLNFLEIDEFIEKLKLAKMKWQD